jgi:hypothetical protein
VHHQRRFGDAKTRTAELLGHGNAQPAGFGQGLVEVVRKAAVPVLLQPVVIIERRAGPLHGVPDLFLLGAP